VRIGAGKPLLFLLNKNRSAYLETLSFSESKEDIGQFFVVCYGLFISCSDLQANIIIFGNQNRKLSKFESEECQQFSY